MLSYLFHRIADRLDGRPTLLIIDEGWLALDDKGFSEQLREWLKTLRKKNASVVFATQSLADIDGSAIAPAIIESCPTRIFLPNDRALEPQIATIYRRFGLNDRQIEILTRATPKRDYYCQSRRGNRLFELGLSEVALAFTAASSKSDQAAIAKIIAEHGRDGFAAAWLRHKGLDWALPHAFPEGGFHMSFHRVFRSRLCKALLAGAAIALFAVPAQAQLFGGIVFDPTNYAQNVLTAVRELQQVNNEIAMLQNQATSLVNQARNLDKPTLFGAGNARSVDHGRQARSSRRRSASPMTSTRSIRHSARPIRPTIPPRPRRTAADRRADPLAELAGWFSRCHARTGGRRGEPRYHEEPDRRASECKPVRHRCAAGGAVRQPARGASDQAACRSHGRHGGNRPRTKPRRCTRRGSQEQADQQTARFLNYGAGYQPGSAQMFH